MPPEAGAAAHYRALESLYAAAPVNRLFDSRISIHDGGDSVELGKQGLNIHSSDGNSIVIDKSGLRINSNADGSYVYENHGTRLIANADGSRVYTGSDGTRYTRNADGSKTYEKGGTRVTLNADGSMTGTSSSGHSLTDSEMKARLAQGESLVKQTEAERARAERQR